MDDNLTEAQKLMTTIVREVGSNPHKAIAAAPRWQKVRDLLDAGLDDIRNTIPVSKNLAELSRFAKADDLIGLIIEYREWSQRMLGLITAARRHRAS